jgi:nucleotide-binding universal stress UspA family protein
MFEKIVLATDLSPTWDEIVACAGEFKALGAKEMILAHVVSVKFLAGFAEKIRAEAGPRLKEQAESLAAHGFSVCSEILDGLPGYAINDAARRYCADLIVVGPQKTARWQERVLGSVAGAVLHHAEFPVLFIKASITADLPPGTCRLQATELLRHVLLPTDFSDTAERARTYVERLAYQGMSQVTLLNALDVPGGEAYPPGFQEMAEGLAQEALEAWQERLKVAGIAVVHPVYDPGRPLPAIIKILETQDISLIVMGTQGKGFIKEIFLGSVAHNVARLAPCPVLLIPPASR